LAWHPDGIGSPRPYPSDYLIAIANVAMAAALGSRLTFVANVALIGFACAYGGLRLSRFMSSAPGAGPAGALLATFNPWVYTKLVAGHLSMILAYGATMLLIAESLRPKPNERRLAFCLILATAQPQFFVIALAYVVVVSLRRRFWLPVVSGLVVALPVFAGIAANQTTLSAIPYNLTWQDSQSVPPLDAVTLGGYFTRYADVLGAFATWPMWVIFALSIAGAVFAPQRKAVLIGLGLAAFVWIVATGVRGPLGNLYAAVVVTLLPSALFRELYDLLGYLAIAYVAFCALASSRFRLCAVAALACGFALAAGWVVHTPWRYWVDLRTLPSAVIPAPENSRFALLPAFQPLAYAGMGAGLDPDAYTRSGNVTPLNTPKEAYPMNVALRQYLTEGRTEMLAALSVSAIVARPDFRSKTRLLVDQTAIVTTSGSEFGASRSSQTIDYVPELSLLRLLPPTDFAAELGAGRIFFGDAARASGAVPTAWTSFRPVVEPLADRAHLRADDGWVDVRQAFLTHPELAQGLGGVVTISPRWQLAIQPGLSALVFVRGTLADQDGKAVFHSGGGYRWVALPRSVRSVRCFGLCVVAAQGILPDGLAQRGPATVEAAVPFRARMPWLISATLPLTGRPELLRYNVTYDEHWTALVGFRALPHVRVDTIVNGWIVPPGDTNRPIFLVETSALVEAVLELTGVTYVISLGLFCLVRRTQ
jgi:hypothetical protein